METSLPWGGTLTGDAGPYDDATWQAFQQVALGAFMQTPSGFVIPGSGSGGLAPLLVRPTSPTSASIRVAIGSALIQGIYYRNDGTPELTLAVAANTSGLDRIDRVVLRADYAAQEVRVVITEGTPDAAPSAPALTQSDGSIWEISLATVVVANGFLTITSDDITIDRYYAEPRLATPPGTIQAYAGASAPSGWLLCYGQTVNIADYPDLFAAIGATYGGDGTTTFGIPDLRGRFALGKDDMGGASANRVTNAQADALGGAAGAETHTLSAAELPAHTHSLTGSVDRNISSGGTFQVSGGGGGNSFSTNSSGGSGQSHNNMPPYVTLNYIIAT